MPSVLKTAVFAIVACAALYAVFAAYAWFVSQSALFAPRPSSYDRLDGAIEITSEDGVAISAMYLPRDGAVTILYSHGNAEDLGDVEPVLRALHSWGFAVLGYDYRGYGMSDGKPTESGTYRDANTAFRYLVEKCNVSSERIVLWGRSLGAGPSLWLASRYRTGGVVLESAFVSAIRVVTNARLLPFDRYDNLRRIRRVNSPVLVVHGKKDDVIPFWHGQMLYDAAAGGKREYVWLDDAGHNDIYISALPRLQQVVSQLWPVAGADSDGRDVLANADEGAGDADPITTR